MIFARLLVFLIGLSVVILTLLSAVKTFVLSRSAPDPLTRSVFLVVRSFFDLRLRWAISYPEKDRLMAFYAPVSVLALLPAWLASKLRHWADRPGWSHHGARSSLVERPAPRQINLNPSAGVDESIHHEVTQLMFVEELRAMPD